MQLPRLARRPGSRRRCGPHPPGPRPDAACRTAAQAAARTAARAGLPYRSKCKLYRYDNDAGEWKERGVGQGRILQHKENKKIRFLMRQDKTLKIRGNHISERWPPAGCRMGAGWVLAECWWLGAGGHCWMGAVWVLAGCWLSAAAWVLAGCWLAAAGCC